MKDRYAVALCVVLFAVVGLQGCASAVPDEVRDKALEYSLACDNYRPVVLSTRSAIAEKIDEFPEPVKKNLIQIDREVLPKLDEGCRILKVIAYSEKVGRGLDVEKAKDLLYSALWQSFQIAVEARAAGVF